MTCCNCKGVGEFFGEKKARRKYRKYLRSGADKSTRKLIQAIQKEGVQLSTLLDIGGGVGAIHHELLSAGAAQATCVDASEAYISKSKEEGERLGHLDSITYYSGNYVELAREAGKADITTLDKVICCFEDMESLVQLSIQNTNKLYGLIYPVERWWTKLVSRVANVMFGLIGNDFSVHIHSEAAIDKLIRENGFQRRYYYKNPLWQVILYGRQ